MTRHRGRRRYEPDWPSGLGRSRKRLGRALLSLSVIIVLAVIASALVGRDEDEPAPTATATPAATPTTSIATPATPLPDLRASDVPLQRRADGWYIEEPARLPLVRVEEVIDGDTLDVRAADTTLRIRVFGINTTERGDRCYSEGRAALQALARSEVRLLRDARLQDSGGRELRYLFTPGGKSIDAEMVGSGLAHAWRDDGAYREVLTAAEDEARASRRGCLWAG